MFWNCAFACKIYQGCKSSSVILIQRSAKFQAGWENKRIWQGGRREGPSKRGLGSIERLNIQRTKVTVTTRHLSLHIALTNFTLSKIEMETEHFTKNLNSKGTILENDVTK